MDAITHNSNYRYKSLPRQIQIRPELILNSDTSLTARPTRIAVFHLFHDQRRQPETTLHTFVDSFDQDKVCPWEVLPRGKEDTLQKRGASMLIFLYDPARPFPISESRRYTQRPKSYLSTGNGS